MRTIQIYTFNELSEEAKEKAVQNCRAEIDTRAFEWEYKNTAEAIAKALDCECSIYSYDGIRYEISFDPIDDLEYVRNGLRAFKYIYNNYILPNERAKTFYLFNTKNRSPKKRKSKINYSIEYFSPTGFCADDCLYFAWENFCKNFSAKSNVSDFLNDVAEAIAELWTEDNEYAISDDGIAEYCENNNVEFFANGRICKRSNFL